MTVEIAEFREKHPDAETLPRTGYALSSRAEWKTPADIKGNDYRLVVAAKYSPGLLHVRFVGTHRQYDRIDAETI
ncbi:MAG: type II toxin-antitoxin system HigB family toxin [Rhodocyclaceae bacterium]|jgi:mRNA interferase HigB|nr:type II toxin-antitoxin system HigB family toxin [Rhodocyclaceae bacterium]